MITITGQVVDATTGQGIPAATMSVNGQSVTVADDQGSFTLSVASSTDVIGATSIGYSPGSVPASDFMDNSLLPLTASAQDLQADVVTPTASQLQKNKFPWWIIAGIGIVGLTSQHKKKNTMGKTSDYLVPVAVLGIGAYLLLKRKTAISTTTPGTTALYSSPGTSSAAASLFNNSAITSLASSIKSLFGGSSSPGAASFTPVGIQQQPGVSTSPDTYSPAADYSTLPTTAPTIQLSTPADQVSPDTTSTDQSAEDFGLSLTGIRIRRRPNPQGPRVMGGALFSADDIVGKTLVAATDVPVYNQANDSATPVATVSSGNGVGVVYSYLNPDTSQGRSELWWMFEAGPDQAGWADSGGYYYVPNNPNYFHYGALQDQGALSAAQQTALAQAANKPLWQQELEKYVPWIIGGILAVGVVKSVINKTL